MDLVEPIIEIVKLVGGPIVRYLKYQIKFNGYLKKFKESKEGLSNRKLEIESRLETQLQSTAYHVAKAEVQEWLKDADKFIARQDVEDEVNSWGCLSCCCRAVILEGRTQELKKIYDRGDNYTRDCLVIEDQSRKLNYDVKNFKELKEKLQRKQGDIGSTLHSQLVHGKIEKEEVKHWREKVAKIIGSIAKDIEDKVDKGGYLSHASDPTAVLLREKIQEMEKIYEEGSRLPDCLVNDDLSASLVELPTPELQGSEGVKANILACLKGEEVTKLGVWGMGGVGKTTIMMHVHNELLKEDKFNEVIWVTVSQNFDIYNLQEQIASSLKENLQERQNTIKRAATLSKMLETHKPYLLILDDVWSSFKLEDVGIPEPNVTNGCKVVLTTRSQEVARSMDCRRIQVKTLSEDEALKLFLNKVGGTALSCPGGGLKKDLESTLKKIVAQCDGLPLAIVTVAGSLKEISEPRLWNAALNQLQDCKRNVAGTDNDAFKILKFSYDRLKNSQIQYCFLYCALYPEDHNIPKKEITERWIDEGFIDEMETRHEMKDEGYDILRKLEDNSLLEFIKDYRGDCVRMHDLIRDMALDITRTSPRFLVVAGKSLTELPEKVKCTEDVEKVSVMFNQIEDIPSSMASSTCTRLTTLLLAHNNLLTIPESVFEHMPELKILDLSFNYKLWSLPNSVSKLVKLTTLLLASTALEKVPSLSGLGSLKKLDLGDTNIQEVPEGLGMLKNLKCLFLGASKIYEIADGVLSNLSKLQELIVNRSRIKLKGDVVGRLKKLEVFYGCFPTANDMRIFLKCQPNRLSTYFIIVGSNWEGIYGNYAATVELPRYEKIMVFNKTSIVGENMLIPSVQVLCIDSCHDIRSLNDFSVIKDATDLRRCVIENCDGMECILSSWINNPVVQTLEYLRLNNLHKLDGLFEANKCRRVKKLFPSWKLVEYLQNLEEIDVGYCEEMEEIIASDPEEEGEGGDIIKELILPKLKELSLKGLPALQSICSRRAVMVCDFLESIEVRDCNGLRRIPFHLPPSLSLYGLDNLDWLFEVELIAMSPPQPHPFSFLKNVTIEKCRRVKKLFPSWKLVEYLQSLKSIYVRDCEEMEEIIASDPEEGGEEGGNIIKELILPKFKSLYLYNLPALKSICSRRAVMVSDSLENIHISNCKALRRIPFRLPPRLSLEKVDNLDWGFEEELIAMSPPQPRTFSFLKEVVIMSCKKIKKLFPSWKLVEYLQSLERIYVYECEEMEEIIGSDPEEEGEEGGDIIKKLILPKLKNLELSGLPALKSICSRKAVMVCDSLEEIIIRDCKGLRRISFHLLARLTLSELDNLDWLFEVELISMSPPQPCTFLSLKKIKIQKCRRVKKLFPSWKLVEYLQNLEEIDVGYCQEMEEIIGSDPEEEEGGDIIKKLILPKLKRLRLERLPTLKSICSRRAVLVCDFLESITIEGCEGLRRIPLSLPLVDNVQPSPPPSLKKIYMRRREEEWWESLEWDHPNANDVLQPMVRFFPAIFPFPSSKSE
ncbi:hypothetical protein SLEP1_g43014 [Rubroshorea leprosula]|uniref:AAA+ ATPase domain-containing protein n=1 Tax=Rubroshorea leprosula TaxID=152421 RepID=A0AAV5LBN2_9ROSI|nr:hypothetical protein SLEP1_g43014 [Rubroshorea leprosula]